MSKGERFFVFIWSIIFCVFSRSSFSEIVSSSPVIVVSATRLDTPLQDLSEDMIVYTQEEIARLPARDLSEVLRYIPGVDVSLNGQFGQATSVSLYGSESRHVLLMIDGVPLNHQISGQANPTRLGVEHIKRIEVIKGASSSAWGSSLGGVIHVITRDVGYSFKPQGRLTNSVAEFKTVKNSLDISGQMAEMGYFFSGSRMETEGILSHADTREIKGFGKLGFAWKDWARIKTSFGYSGGDVRYGTRLDGLDTYTPYIFRHGNLSLELEQEDKRLYATFKYHDQDINTQWIVARSGASVVQTDHSSMYKGFSLKGSLNLRDRDVLVGGVDFDCYRIKSANLFDKSRGLCMQAPYANYIFHWRRWKLIPGVRFDHNQAFGSQWSPSLGVVYHVPSGHHLQWRFKVARGFNAPPMGWLYNYDPSPQVLAAPNPDLKAEKATVYMTGLSARFLKTLTLRLNMHWTEVDHAIANEKTPEGLIKKVNKDRFRYQSVELGARYDFQDNWHIFFHAGLNHVKDLLTDLIVRDYGRRRQWFQFGFYYKNSYGFGLNMNGSYNRWASSPSEANDRKVILDMKLTQTIPLKLYGLQWELFINGYNLTNSSYWAHPAFPLARRYFEGGLSFQF